MKRQPFTLLIHIALVIILAGALTTHFCGIQGEVFLPDGGAPTESFTKTSGPGDGRFPFEIALEMAEIKFYPGTSTPMDFCSHLRIGNASLQVSMNKICEVDGWRFYQSGISPEGSTLAVCHDPWGIGITYTGYAMLAIGMIGFFFQRNTFWYNLLRVRKTATSLIIVLYSAFSASASELPAMQAPLAKNFGKVYVYWNDRVCPMQTMARDVTIKLYGSETYKGLNAEQVLSGWLFYFDSWERDYNTHRNTPTDQKQIKKAEERNLLVQWLGSGDAFKIYPYHTATGYMEWLSLSGRRPSQMSLEQWQFMQTTMPEIKGLLLEGKNIKANEKLFELIEKQTYYAGIDNLPSPAKMTAERAHNTYARPALAAIVAMILALFYLTRGIKQSPNSFLSKSTPFCLAVLCLLCAYISTLMASIWWISGHIPISNGPETMHFMALIALLGALYVRSDLPRGALICVAALTLFVSAMAGRTPRIGPLMPVLASPWLSVHVMLVMMSYVLFILMAILSAVALISRDKARLKSLAKTNRIILTPAVFLLAGGIFVGAVWANCSWGRYWGWDPKETSALVMLLIYSIPLHSRLPILNSLNKPKNLHLFLLIAVFTVVFTYFGANYLLPGKHSYA